MNHGKQNVNPEILSMKNDNMNYPAIHLQLHFKIVDTTISFLMAYRFFVIEQTYSYASLTPQFSQVQIQIR